MNTTLGTGDAPLAHGFLDWRAWSNKNPDMDVAKLMARSCKHLSPEESAAYAAPFPAAEYKAGVRRGPKRVPAQLDADGAALARNARDWWGKEWSGQTFMAVGMKDPVLGAPVMAQLQAQIRNCPPPFELPEAGHFIQEWGDVVARQALEALR